MAAAVPRNYREPPFVVNIEKATLANRDYRRVLYTDRRQQLVLMSLPPGGEVGEEKHVNTTQFIRVESGTAEVILGRKDKYTLRNGDIIVIPFNTTHNVRNISSKHTLQLYTIYSPAEHPPHTIESEKLFL